MAAALWLARFQVSLPATDFVDLKTLTSSVEKPLLGMTLQQIPPLSAGLRPDAVVAREVHGGSPAARAGVQPRDVIAVIDDQCVVSARQAAELLHNAPADGTIMLEVRRSGGYVVLALSAASLSC